MVPAKVKIFLDSIKIKSEVLEHKTVYTAHDKAATLRLPEKVVGKTLVVKLDNKLALVLIPANRNLDKKKLIKAANTAKVTKDTKVKKVEFATERLIKSKLKGVRVGAVLPFGILWKIPTFVDRALLNNKTIVLSAGTHEDSVKMTPAQYKKALPELIAADIGKKR
ncbi:MAG: hypothetical protein A2667_03110 [Candidatus Wildermuthbacteria bacterium RIFCSPHIGHO2_01_FULL_47_27]|uniref:YbaK/aminoacyl-tRNA synthetase-associated domain-containing protein n=2 Tax=Candidatus Wildermuthiibacteriota TaxID=1817923 RepID=A0A1G2RMX4_9BACT|nr:MAG: hypothetical protein A2667_03110 [Candidatus Wildermuthbacteria bacterium RIFCSPHIGHO2_01_FULL_47_27]OHA67989.1 MAG: hypothetical protein A3D59_02550 [Candidatus Wildermuthbacteria bacterium RIFCSPHIGHO2_02_FULL_47_17]OHA73848.1 MAG: hypothetical protein A3A32_02940 [Candidatus Wildermuthbacteria bacterium RIFCSPLOWO2_01_FULL_48_35]OHA76536.1 MAG: hypothetical protein A3I38_03615 [Candidatus Wildermuthbacteria bacterium RIFCSPLOWO2_02_FULL_47_10]